MENSLIVGQIVKPQGIRGEVKVVPFTDGAEDFHAFKRVFLDGEEYKVDRKSTRLNSSHGT